MAWNHLGHVGGIPEFITENETGWLFDPNNEEELVAKMNTIIASPSREIQLIGTNGKNHVNDRFTSEKYITNLENLYCINEIVTITSFGILKN